MDGSTHVCQFYKYGYCRYREVCRNQHVKDVCDNKNCDVKRCQKRHPKVCTYFRKSQRCKFGVHCLYSHESEQILSRRNDDVLEILSKIKNLEEKNIELMKKVESLEKVIEAKSNMAEGDTNMTQLDEVAAGFDAGNQNSQSVDQKSVSLSKRKNQLLPVPAFQVKENEVMERGLDSRPSPPPHSTLTRCCVHECLSNSLWSFKTP